MTTKPISQRVLNPRSRPNNSLDADREKFEQTQIASISKAINAIESPVKEKHVRRIIIGTFQEKRSQTFWKVVRSLPLQENPIVCWKFCHVLHKMLREGYRKIIQESYQFVNLLKDLGKMWGLLKEGYGKLIQNYCTLLVIKINFHARNQRIPGNLIITDAELDNIGENDVNIFFQLCCEIFDYLDEILSLQANVYGSLDMSRSNSMTNAGQCRLAPLIPCIQDSTQLYDFSVKVLFKLHAVLPPGTLDGHRHRFLNQFKILKQFYLNSRNLQYFKNLIHVPLLPENPPNFLLQSDLNSHVTPIAVLPQQPDSPENEIVDNLVDLSFNDPQEETNSTWSYQSDSQNGSMTPSIIEEKDRIIQRLMNKIEELELEIQQIRIIDGQMIEGLKRSITELECAAAQKMEKELEELRQELERTKNNSCDVSTVQSEVDKVTDKFVKMKDIYNKLREEHIVLLRTKAESDKQFAINKAKMEEALILKSTLENQLKEHVKKEAEFSSMSSNMGEMQDKLNAKQLEVDRLNITANTIKQEKSMLESKFNELLAQDATLNTKMSQMENDFLHKIREREWQLFCLLLSEVEVLAKRVEGEDIETSSVNVNCSPEYFFSQTNLLSESLSQLQKSSNSLSTAPNIDEMIKTVLQYFYQLYYVVNCAKVTSQTLPNIELGEELMSLCKELATLSINSTHVFKSKNDPSVSLNSIRVCLDKIINKIRAIIPELAADQATDLGELLMTELNDMDKAIQDAANRIEQMMINASKKDTGVKLEVNGKILDACTTLMQAIMQLIHNSKELQKEIVSQGKGFASPKEFYQRNHRWTEGLISAAKVVALAAKLLVDAADKVVSGKGKFEELMVASQEIAAATAQLVVSSRVKADRTSQNMNNLSSSSKKVSEATGNVVATAKTCSALIEDTDDMDFSKLSLHQAKRLEMESQVRLLELESLLTKERTKLSSLRRQHYHLAGASEGWDQ